MNVPVEENVTLRDGPEVPVVEPLQGAAGGLLVSVQPEVLADDQLKGIIDPGVIEMLSSASPLPTRSEVATGFTVSVCEQFAEPPGPVTVPV